MKTLILAASAAVALALTGCSGGGTDSSAPASGSAETPAASQPAAAESTPLSQGEWVELCGPEGTNPDDPKCFEDSANPTVKAGEWGELVQTYADGETQASGIRVDKVEYETTLPKAASNPEWDGGEEIPQYIDAEAEAGYKFAVVEYTIKNTSKKPNMPQFPGSVLTGADEEFAPGVDQEEYGDNLGRAADENHGSNINPGVEVKQFLIVEIPEDQTVKSVYFTDPYMDSYAILQIDL